MIVRLRFVFAIFAIIAACTVSINAQVANVSTAVDSSTAASVTPVPDVTDGPYTLKKGDNELGFWAGGSFKPTTAFAGLTEAEARDRKFFIAAVRYGRTLWANDSVALQYTLDAIPLAVATDNIRSSTTIGGVTTFQRDTTYGAGATPLGLQLDFANGSKVHPFVHVNGGFLVFTQSMPLPDSGRLALVGEAGTGVRIFTSERRAVTLGVRFHHISNGDRSGSNRGLNQFVFYGGFSIFR
jgi:lipid A 3-O-deacylase PagL